MVYILHVMTHSCRNVLACSSCQRGLVEISVEECSADLLYKARPTDTRWQQYSTHIHTQTVHRTTQLICEEAGRAPVFASYTLTFVIQLRKKHGKSQSG